ncbi:hypothetical protein M6B38_363110 [Iris pallida]|uniref:Uncharacterized protein n=1 Tax=Iris pallida TaxID=29817 RepID=A0AAX6FHI5_IRIPA|nr:hypothetical protein M6B38_134185 [Iris pallida]KAJ6828430.1 hypothetical protein M6B38_363110 [Iris pallida]
MLGFRRASSWPTLSPACTSPAVGTFPQKPALGHMNHPGFACLGNRGTLVTVGQLFVGQTGQGHVAGPRRAHSPDRSLPLVGQQNGGSTDRALVNGQPKLSEIGEPDVEPTTLPSGALLASSPWINSVPLIVGPSPNLLHCVWEHLGGG